MRVRVLPRRPFFLAEQQAACRCQRFARHEFSQHAFCACGFSVHRFVVLQVAERVTNFFFGCGHTFSLPKSAETLRGIAKVGCLIWRSESRQWYVIEIPANAGTSYSLSKDYRRVVERIRHHFPKVDYAGSSPAAPTINRDTFCNHLIGIFRFRKDQTASGSWDRRTTSATTRCANRKDARKIESRSYRLLAARAVSLPT